MKLNQKKAVKYLVLTFFALILSLGAPINAQDEKKKEQIEPVEELLVVTGSRIKRTDAEGAAPIDVITREEIAATGATSIDRILQELPSVTGGSLNTNISNGNDDRSTLRIRGLTPSNTLILLNGRRLALHGFPGGTNSSSSVDLNTIPLQAVERIEVFKDGGSAVYGSDAVAGVVNIITRKNFDGFEIPLYYGQASRGDLQTQNYSFIYGTGTDRGRITISGNYYDQGVIWSRDRNISDDADARSLGGINSRSSATPEGRFTVDGNVLTLDPSLGDGSSTTHFVPYDFDLHGYNFAENTPAVIPQERSNIFLDGSWSVNENLDFFVEAHYVKIKTRNSLAPTPIFLAFEAMPIVVSGQNRYNPFGVDIADARRRMVEFENRVANYEGDNYRFVSGIKGSFADTWEWDTNFIWHEDKRTNFQTGALVHSRMVLATGPDSVCQADPSCVPINLFGGPGSITPEMLDYVSTSGQFSGTSSMKIVGFNLTGNLGLLQGGPIGLAVGAEYREETGADNPDSQTAQGNTIGFTNFEPTHGSRDVTELYAEVNFPILNGVRGAQLLEVNTAVRYSDYSDFGNNTAPKFGIRWQPISEVMIRATASEAFKAPTVGQLFSGSNESFPTLVDPLLPTGLLPMTSAPNSSPFLAATKIWSPRNPTSSPSVWLWNPLKTSASPWIISIWIRPTWWPPMRNTFSTRTSVPAVPFLPTESFATPTTIW